jgi:small-conductance mechanosensitive channel
MPDIAPFHGPIVVLHVLGVIGFLLAHGVSATVLLRLRTERNPDTLRTLLDLSRRSVAVMSVGFVVWFLTGIAAGFSGNWWTSGRYWIWVSLAIAIVITGVMTPMGRFYLDRVRAALGMDAKGSFDSTAQVDPVALEAAIASGRPGLLAAIGIGGLAILGWLMVAKPF